jgi:putative flippase GtrA
MEKIENSRWKLSMVGFTTFVLAAIFYLITGPNIPAILGFLTSAIVLFIINAVYVFYTNKKSRNTKKSDID